MPAPRENAAAKQDAAANSAANSKDTGKKKNDKKNNKKNQKQQDQAAAPGFRGVRHRDCRSGRPSSGVSRPNSGRGPGPESSAQRKAINRRASFVSLSWCMPDNTFDVVSKVELTEVSNAVQQTIKEVQQRYDLKDSKSTVELNEKEHKLILHSQDEFKLRAVLDILEQKLVKRHVPLKALNHGTVTPAAGSSVRQEITLQQGIPIEKAREIVRLIKDSKKKVQASIQGDLVRVSGKDRDALQEIIQLLRGADFGIDMQFTNYRSN